MLGLTSCTAVRDELSEEKMLERVAEDAVEKTLTWSNELRWLDDVSFVELELYVE